MDTLLYPNEPIGFWRKPDIDGFMIWAAGHNASDVSVYPDSHLWMRCNGHWVRATVRKLSVEEVFFLLESTSNNPSSETQIRRGEDLDYSYEVRIDRSSRLRFRVNCTACRTGYGTGANIVLRSIPDIPPELESLNVEQGLLDHCWPGNGMVLMTGVMGTGKSTLMASVLRRLNETRADSIITYEAPIEFRLTDLPESKGPVVQTEIPWHLPSFARASRNSGRRAPQVVYVGEARDEDTLSGMIQLAEMGSTVYATLHTASVSATPNRIINVFHPEMRHQITASLIGSLRLIIQQRLLPSPKGGRQAIREYLAFTSDIRKQLYMTPINDMQNVIEKYVNERGQTLLKDAREKLEQGLITEAAYHEIEYEKHEEPCNVA